MEYAMIDPSRLQWLKEASIHHAEVDPGAFVLSLPSSVELADEATSYRGTESIVSCRCFVLRTPTDLQDWYQRAVIIAGNGIIKGHVLTFKNEPHTFHVPPPRNPHGFVHMHRKDFEPQAIIRAQLYHETAREYDDWLIAPPWIPAFYIGTPIEHMIEYHSGKDHPLITRSQK